MTNTSSRQKIIVEIIWWIFTFLVAAVVLLPIISKVPSYPFLGENLFFIIAFITFSRYIFFFKFSWIARTRWVKLFMIAISVILFFVMTTGLSDFHNFLEEQGLQTLVTHLDVNQQTRLINYMKNEMVFFGVGSIISGILLPIRMIISFWRMRNRGTV